MKHLFSARRK